MQTLAPPDTHFLSAAVGWYELGNLEEAKGELAKVAAAAQNHPDVLEVCWLIHAQEKNWDRGLAVAEKLFELAPERVVDAFLEFALPECTRNGEILTLPI